ncbi:MAG: hypothetical protein KBD48_00465 [Candidatus Pacebacteria bacterium]|nr:hypothetical protein [Candidatus Paceibacterota bacterium]MBP9715652.1 hypothetical protein [Candidatus Paceibacterota bacterium]
MNKAKEITQTLGTDMNMQRIVFRVLVSSLVLLAMVYIYFIGSITFNVIARKTLETNMHELGSRVSNLELSYLASSNSVDKNFALSVGFVDATSPIFATRSVASRVALR